MRRLRSIATSLALVAAILSTTPARPVDQVGQVFAGAARVDSTWHVGASAGQYASASCPYDVVIPSDACVGTSVGDHGVDPFTHQTRRNPSYGIQGREWVRALLIEGKEGQRVAIVANDLYIPQDLVNRRVAGILAEYDSTHPNTRTRVTPENLTISVSHSHSSPYYSTPSWGVWLFQDVFDIRYFEHIASKMAEAVIKASAGMVPVRMGAATIPFTVDGTPHGHSWLKKHSYGPTQADDRSPAGYPRWDTDRDLAVLRFDDVSNPETPEPLATWVVWGNHPENLDGNDLLTGEYVNTMYRIVDREIGGITLFSQNDTGTSEAHDLAHNRGFVNEVDSLPPHLRQEFSHKEYAQVERAARTLADGVEHAWTDIAKVSAGEALPAGHQVVRFRSDFEVGFKDLRFAPPSYRVFPSVSSCRTEKAFDGNPGVPIVGLPDCGFVFGNRGENPVVGELKKKGIDPGVTYDMLRDLCGDGVQAACVPDNVGAPSYTGLEETLQVHLQAIRLGDVAITVCPCEQWADQSRNIKSRLDTVKGNLWYGWDWTANYTDSQWQPGVIYDGKDLPGHGPITLNDWCIQKLNGDWACKNPSNPSQRQDISNYVFERMKAQIYNDATGWDLPENSLRAETEPTDVEKVWGNFIHEELTEHGYDMVVTVGMTNDYWGYLASYREFQRGDHYRKALTGLGPHSEDFMATRLSRMAAELNGGPPVALGPKDLSYQWDYQHQGARQEVLGGSARTYLPVYELQMPADGGTPGITTQPNDIARFAATHVKWIGGSNWTDSPQAIVERCIESVPFACDPTDQNHWVTFATGEGEVQVKVNYPQATDMPAWRSGNYQWIWEATFEAADSDITLPDAQRIARNQTPAGVYRFVIEGCHRGKTAASIPPDSRCISWEPSSRVKAYRLTSEPFQVRPWDGITVDDIRIEPGGKVSFEVGPVYQYASTTSNADELYDYSKSTPIEYPNTYPSPFRFIHDRQDSSREEDDDVRTYGDGPEDDEVYCFHCSFRPWADTGAVKTALISVARRGRSGKVELFPAVYDPSDGRWHSSIKLKVGDRAWVARGGVIDYFGEFNGAPSTAVVREPPRG